MTQIDYKALYKALCATVEQDCMRIFGLAGTGQCDAAAEAAAILGEHAATCRQQAQMQEERAGDAYALNTLTVHLDAHAPE